MRHSCVRDLLMKECFSAIAANFCCIDLPIFLQEKRPKPHKASDPPPAGVKSLRGSLRALAGKWPLKQRSARG